MMRVWTCIVLVFGLLASDQLAAQQAAQPYPGGVPAPQGAQPGTQPPQGVQPGTSAPQYQVPSGPTVNTGQEVVEIGPASEVGVARRTARRTSRRTSRRRNY